MNTSRFPLILEEVNLPLFPALLLWSAISGILIGVALVLQHGDTAEAVVGGVFFAVLFAVVSHIAYSRGWTPDWPTLVLRWVVGLLVAVVATLTKWLVYDDPYLLSYVITYLVLVGWVMFVTGEVIDYLARWYCCAKNINPKKY